ncbi:MAG TPA: phosphate acyltransferase PlsX [Candidatus Dormibacteraeota bacterium]|jgi:glycerol-3-phosphate acyltransferase PlsX|nr:phosphate acyltransferase PlsX [Candidatus Dormibacteraeota bacterium]
MPAASTLPIALDAMGGDNAPREIVLGALLGAARLGVHVALVGQSAVLEAEIAAAPASVADAQARGRVSIVDAAEVIGMDEHPAAAVRAKKGASVVVACEMVAGGRARAAVSAGNSGAVLAAALFHVKRLRGVARPAIGTTLPRSDGGSAFMLDVGANADVRPEWLAQFGVMGSVYARSMMGVESPRVGLLSNGEEPGKGSALVQAATPLLAAAPIRFVGNVEGKDLFHDVCDVVVTDGFTGNIALKTAEGVGEFLFSAIGAEARKSLQGKLGGALLKPKLRPIRDRVDYRATGGALLLGVDGEVVIAHGRSDAEAIVSALRVAHTAAERDVHSVIGREIAAVAAAGDGDGEAGAATQSTHEATNRS